ncbi:unnamed protein product [Paramecium octaurelia]|uniref:Uncharacterized protein n=1 Tax=Paramecium octaurelia TaxID=43137 RepID=A0A8S1WUA2_PAROT|nr:unnamed protein product [Paramecium octaurelia]
MQNLKIVYQQKMHKLPSSVVTYQDIIDAVKKIYPNLSQFYLFTIIPQFQEIEEINCEFSFSFLKKIYKNEGWITIKFLVLEDKNLNNLNAQSLSVLNQSSMIINSSRLDQTQYSQLNQTRIKIEEIKQKVDYAKDEKLKEQVKKILDEKLKEYGLVKKKITITELAIPDNYFQEQKNVQNKYCLNYWKEEPEGLLNIEEFQPQI